MSVHVYSKIQQWKPGVNKIKIGHMNSKNEAYSEDKPYHETRIWKKMEEQATK
jgi:hypothetical protein